MRLGRLSSIREDVAMEKRAVESRDRGPAKRTQTGNAGGRRPKAPGGRRA